MKKIMVIFSITALLVMGSMTVSAETEGPLLHLDPIPGDID